MAKETSAPEEFFVALVLGTLNIVSWVREQWLLWLMLGSIAAAYFSPFVLALSVTPIVASVGTGLTFFLTGLTLPIAEMRGLHRHAALILMVVLQCFVLSPLIGFALYHVPLFTSEASHALLVTGLLCSCWLPTPMLVSSIATAAAGGSETVAQVVSIVVNMVGLLGVSPVGIQLTMRHTGALSMPSSDSIPSFIGTFAATSLVPLFLGHCLQQVLQSTSWRHLLNNDEQLKRQLTSATVTCSEVCDTTHSNWRHRARQLSIATLLFLNYVIFSASFHHSASVQRERELEAAGQTLPPDHHHAVAVPEVRGKDLTWSALGIMVLAVFVMQALQALLSWIGMAMCCHASMSPEERIAAFFLSFQKSELLALPLLIQICACSASDPKTAAFLVLPSIAVHLTQSIIGGVLTHPLRLWRNRQHCRPGTTLLPLRYTKVPKHALPNVGNSSPYFTNGAGSGGGGMMIDHTAEGDR